MFYYTFPPHTKGVSEYLRKWHLFGYTNIVPTSDVLAFGDNF